jgi:hypothetical protein
MTSEQNVDDKQQRDACFHNMTNIATLRKVPNDLSGEEKQVLALVEGIIKTYTATLAIVMYAQIQSPKPLLSFVVLLSQLQLFLCNFLWLSE